MYMYYPTFVYKRTLAAGQMHCIAM